MNDTPLTSGRFVIPHVVTSQFYLKEGDLVGDFGAGAGYFLPALVAAVGAEGEVYAVEVQKNLVEKLSNVARTNGYNNVQALWGDIEEVGGTAVPEGLLDAAILVNTFFQVEDKSACLQEVWRTLRSGGKLFIIDWSESFAGLGPQPDDVVTKDDAEALVETAGYTFERSFDAGDHHYGLAFRKP